MLSNSHSIEHAFDDLYIEVGGVRVNICVSGSAELECDPGYGFVVKSITLDGTVPDKSKAASIFFGLQRKEAKVTIDANSDDNAAEFFGLLCDALYDDRGAQEAWQREIDEEEAA